MRAFLFCMIFSVSYPLFAAQPTISFDKSQPGRTTVLAGSEPIAEFVWSDSKIPRPYFCRLKTLRGHQVTRNHPPIEGQDVADHPEFHPGLWLAFGDVSGNDYWRNKARVVCDAESVKTSAEDHMGTIEAVFKYLDQQDEDKVVCEEHFRGRLCVQGDAYVLLWDSTFTGPKPFYLGDQEEMGLGFRVATSMRAERQQRGEIAPGTGRIRDAEGRVNGEEVWGNTSSWCDYRGQVEGKDVGLTLLCHPENFRPSWFHARDYGLLVANPFGRRAFHKGEPSNVVVNPGDSLRLRYGILVYDQPANGEIDLDAAYKGYLEIAQVKGE